MERRLVGAARNRVKYFLNKGLSLEESKRLAVNPKHYVRSLRGEGKPAVVNKRAGKSAPGRAKQVRPGTVANNQANAKRNVPRNPNGRPNGNNANGPTNSGNPKQGPPKAVPNAQANANANRTLPGNAGVRPMPNNASRQPNAGNPTQVPRAISTPQANINNSRNVPRNAGGRPNVNKASITPNTGNPNQIPRAVINPQPNAGRNIPRNTPRGNTTRPQRNPTTATSSFGQQRAPRTPIPARNDNNQNFGKPQPPNMNVSNVVKLAVIPSRYPAVQWNPNQLVAIKESILDEIRNQRGGDVKPVFSKCTFERGWLSVYCENQYTAEWLREVLRTLNLWWDADPIVVHEGDLGYPQFVIGYFPAMEKSATSDIIQLLEGQNDDLRINNWVVMNRMERGNTIALLFQVDVASAIILNRKNYQLNYAFGQITLSTNC